MDCKIATVATKWWIDQITKRCKELYPSKVIESESGLVIVDTSLQKEICNFQELLYNQIIYSLRFYKYLNLSCYYWPSGDLKVLVKKARIPQEYIPIRANMQIYDGYIEVSLNGEDLHKLSLHAE